MIVKLENAQAIQNAIYDLGETGLTQIIGHNSNGKSILFKALTWLTTMQFKREDKRRSFIKKGTHYALISILHDGKIFVAKIAHDRNECEFLLVRKNQDKIIRTFREGGIEELLDEFGFITLYEEGVCLNLCETFGAMPFVNTSMKLQSKLVKKITTDSTAEKFMENYKEMHKLVLAESKANDKDLERLKIEKGNLILYPYEELETLSKRMDYVYALIKCLQPYKLEPIQVPPNIKFIDTSKIPRLNPLPILPDFGNKVRLIPLTELVKDLQAFEKGECPTCGKQLMEGGVCHDS